MTLVCFHCCLWPFQFFFQELAPYLSVIISNIIPLVDLREDIKRKVRIMNWLYFIHGLFASLVNFSCSVHELSSYVRRVWLPFIYTMKHGLWLPGPIVSTDHFIRLNMIQWVSSDSISIDFQLTWMLFLIWCFLGEVSNAPFSLVEFLLIFLAFTSLLSSTLLLKLWIVV